MFLGEGYLFIYLLLVGLLPACFAHSFVAESGQIVDLFGVQLPNSAIQEEFRELLSQNLGEKRWKLCCWNWCRKQPRKTALAARSTFAQTPTPSGRLLMYVSRRIARVPPFR